MTPTTAAVMAVSGAVNFRLPCVVSTSGPRSRMKMNEGRKVNQVTRLAATAPAMKSFGGFINFGSPIKGSSVGADGKPHEFVVSENVINQPLFHTLKTTSSVSMHDGPYVVLGGLAGFSKLGSMKSEPTYEPADLGAKPDLLYFFIIQAKILRP